MFKTIFPTVISFFVLQSQNLAQGVSTVKHQTNQIVLGKSVVVSKNYYLISIFDQLPEVNLLIKKDTILNKIYLDKRNNIKNSLDSCKSGINCFTEFLKFSDKEINLIGTRLSELYTNSNILGKIIRNYIIPSGAYRMLSSVSGKELLTKVWEQDARGINYCISVYMEGKKPNYPLIDSISFKVYNSQSELQSRYWSLLYNVTSMIYEEKENDAEFYSFSLAAALYSIELNEREQAADFEPIEKGENKLAFKRIQSVQWNKYPYTVIVIPGAGPDEPRVPLSAEGMIRCRLAATQYKKGLAPFIIPSGGKVHPYKTNFCEAFEMKKFLMNHLQIPENAIIIEPHARHTTTNMRNSVRLMYRYGIPFDKHGLVCTTRDQSNMITTSLAERCWRELKLIPYKNGKRLSATLSEFVPLLDALQINPYEPIDP